MVPKPNRDNLKTKTKKKQSTSHMTSLVVRNKVFLPCNMYHRWSYNFTDPGSNNSGYYELTAVLTHQGRSSSSGHYLAWVKYKEQEWLKLDDDKVSVVLEDDILKLSGGGIREFACVCVHSFLTEKLFFSHCPLSQVTGT